MRERASARLLVIDDMLRVLLFRFVQDGEAFWGTPGGEVEKGETFSQAALRELEEETGLRVPSAGGEIGTLRFEMQLHTGEQVISDEHYFLIRTTDNAISNQRWTELERRMISDHRWWSRDDLAATKEVVYPLNLAELLRAAGSW